MQSADLLYYNNSLLKKEKGKKKMLLESLMVNAGKFRLCIKECVIGLQLLVNMAGD